MPGVAGKLIDLDETSQILTDVMQRGGSPTIRVGTVELITKFNDDQVVDLVGAANKIVDTQPELRLNDYQTLFPAHGVASWFARASSCA